MTIRYNNGPEIEAVLLSREGTTMRIALHGSEDVLQLESINGTWITEECEPVQVDFAWTGRSPLDLISEEDCICSPELAAKLLHLLFAGENDPDAKNPAPRPTHAPVYQQLV